MHKLKKKKNILRKKLISEAQKIKKDLEKSNPGLNSITPRIASLGSSKSQGNIVSGGGKNYTLQISPQILADTWSNVKLKNNKIVQWTTQMLKNQLELSWDTKSKSKITNSETGISRMRVMRNAVFIAGEAGVGKTELLRNHAAELANRYGARYQEWSALSWKERDNMMIWASGIDDVNTEIDPKTGEVKEELYQKIQQRLEPYYNGEESVHLRDFVLIAIDTPQMMPGALRGIPNLSEVSRLYLRTTVDSWQYYSSLPRSAGVVLFDELTSTSSEVLKEFHSLLLSGSTYETQLGNYWQIVAAGNLNIGADEGRAADLYDAEQLSTALANRLKIGWYFPSVDAWVKWARNKGVVSFLIDFVQVPDKEGNFTNFIDEPEARGEHYANPRNLVRFSNELITLMEKYEKINQDKPFVDDKNFWSEFWEMGIGIIGYKFMQNLSEYLRLQNNFNLNDFVEIAFTQGDPFDITKTQAYQSASEADRKKFDEASISYGYQAANFIANQAREFIDDILRRPIEEIEKLPQSRAKFSNKDLNTEFSLNLIKLNSDDEAAQALRIFKILLCSSVYNVNYDLNVDANEVLSSFKENANSEETKKKRNELGITIVKQLNSNDIKNRFPDVLDTIIVNGIQEPITHYFSLVFLGIQNKFFKETKYAPRLSKDIEKDVESTFQNLNDKIKDLQNIGEVLNQKLKIIQGIIFDFPYDRKELSQSAEKGEIDAETFAKALRVNFIWNKIVQSSLMKTFLELENSLRKEFINTLKKAQQPSQ